MNQLTMVDDPNSLVPYVENKFDELLSEVVGGKYLPRIQLFISSSDYVKMGKIDMNHYGLVSGKDMVEDLGKEIDVLICFWRPRALDTSDKSNIRSSCDIRSSLFQDIKAKTSIKNSGCQFGPEYLVWLPAKEVFATFFLGSASARNEAKNVHPLVGKVATFKSRLLSNDSYKWQAPYVIECSTPLSILPDREKIREVIEAFRDVPEQPGLEVAEVSDRRER